MAFFGKTYHLVNHENFDVFLKEVAKHTDEQVKKYLEQKISFKVDKNGDTYTITITKPDGVQETTFKSGVEFDETINQTKLKNCYVVDGNTVNQTLKHEPDNSYTKFKRTFNGDDLVVEITSSKWNGVAKNFYKA